MSIKLLILWVPGTDYSALRASPLRGRPKGRSPPLRAVVEPACCLSAVRIDAVKRPIRGCVIQIILKSGSPGRTHGRVGGRLVARFGRF
jgi:hypothetical protein